MSESESESESESVYYNSNYIFTLLTKPDSISCCSTQTTPIGYFTDQVEQWWYVSWAASGKIPSKWGHKSFAAAFQGKPTMSCFPCGVRAYVIIESFRVVQQYWIIFSGVLVQALTKINQCNPRVHHNTECRFSVLPVYIEPVSVHWLRARTWFKQSFIIFFFF